MAHAKVSLKIKAWQAAFVVRSLNLYQPFNGHPSFEIIVALPEIFVLTVDILKNIKGEKAEIKIVTLDKSSEDEKERTCNFTGFVDQINTIWTTSGRMLRVKGFSSTIFMDCSPRFRTFSNQSLSSILQKIFKEYASGKLPKLSHKAANHKVPFAVQNQETDYLFLCRLADDYGKIFFSANGKEVYFGDLKGVQANEVILRLGKDCQHLELSQNLAPLNFQLKAYNLLKNKEEYYNNDAKYGNTNSTVQSTIEKSKVYPSGKIHLNYLIEKAKDLEVSAKKTTARQAHELVCLSGTSNRPDLQIGSQITIKGGDFISEQKYIVMEVNHQVSSDDSYQNSFVAIPKGFPFAPQMYQGQKNVCGPLAAIVKNHQDPEKLGRIQVQFIGDMEQSLSPWLRVLVPFSRKNGFYFLPEKEDKVMVFFEDFNPEKSPFVLGSFYHGQSKPEKWVDANNQKKGIQTEKITFTFDDKTGKLTIEAEEIELKANKEMNIDGGRQLTQKATRIDLNP